MRIELHPAAEQDIEEAAAFYASEGSPALAARFLSEFERVARLLLSDPGLGTPRTRGRRSFPTAGFPYTVIYRAQSSGIRVLVVKHDRQRPEHGRLRR
jgi:plasmid stabilization system protein ParE